MTAKLRSLIYYMYSQDRNGSWLDLFTTEITKKDIDYIRETLETWYTDSRDPVYLLKLNLLDVIEATGEYKVRKQVEITTI